MQLLNLFTASSLIWPLTAKQHLLYTETTFRYLLGRKWTRAARLFLQKHTPTPFARQWGGGSECTRMHRHTHTHDVRLSRLGHWSPEEPSKTQTPTDRQLLLLDPS